MVKRNGRSGFSLVQLTVGIGAITALLSTGVEMQLIERNEAAALQTLRQIADAQESFKSVLAIDTDSDGVGEYGYFGEMAGSDPMRIDNGLGAPAPGTVAMDILNPSILPAGFGRVWWDPRNDGAVVRGGYVFKIFIPQYPQSLLGAGESVHGGADSGALPWADGAEEYWCAYAYPLQRGLTGQRAFCINQSGMIVATANDIPSRSYSWDYYSPQPQAAAPSADSAYASSSMAARLANGTVARDMNLWSALP